MSSWRHQKPPSEQAREDAWFAEGAAYNEKRNRLRDEAIAKARRTPRVDADEDHRIASANEAQENQW